jgi:hypothetical protein
VLPGREVGISVWFMRRTVMEYAPCVRSVRTKSNCVPDPWQLCLVRSVRLTNGFVLETLADVRELILALPSDVQKQSMWQALCEDLLAAADTEYTNGVTNTLETVLNVWSLELSDRGPK